MQDRIQIHANGVDFVCLTQGSGPLLLLVHGFPDIPQSWSAQMDALSQAGYKVIVSNSVAACNCSSFLLATRSMFLKRGTEVLSNSASVALQLNELIITR